MTKPSKPRTGRKRRGNRPTTASRKPTERPGKVARTLSRRPPAAGATAGGAAERAAVGLFARTRVVALNAPDSRPEVVDRYRRLLAEGRFRPDLEAVAERMIREGLLENIEK
jgi:hypothetical protein